MASHATRITISEGQFRRQSNAKLRIATACIVLSIVVATTILIYHHLHTESKANQIRQASLQNQLNGAVLQADNNTVITDATQLINSEHTGAFKMEKQQLAQIYIQRGFAYFNIKKYTQADSDFTTGTTLGHSLDEAALLGQIESRYALGQRKQLIPLIQQLIGDVQKSTDPMANSTIMQYQYDIQALKNGQEIDI